MIPFAIVGLAAVFLCGALYWEKRGSVRGNLINKTAASLLFIAAALVQPHSQATYAAWILGGLVFCLGGDVFLAIPGKKTFLFGLVSFLVGHLLYVMAFSTLIDLGPWFWAGLPPVVGVSAFIYYWLYPYLDTMKKPVLAYIVVISAMLTAAWSVLGVDGLSASGRLTVFLGALLFYVSDIFVARKRFLTPGFSSRLIGLPLYYAGQFLLAFSVGMVG